MANAKRYLQREAGCCGRSDREDSTALPAGVIVDYKRHHRG